jgi:hypothetical protein
MLSKRGVPCSIKKLKLAELKKIVTRQRPVEIAVDLKSVPFVVRKHSFASTHTIVALQAVSSVCPVHKKVEPGMLIFDPNFHRNRPVHPSQIFYPDHYLRPAFEGYGGYAIVPDKAKVVSTRHPYVHRLRVTTPVNVRTGPGGKYADVGTLPRRTIIRSLQIETNGQAYKVNGKVRRDWISHNFKGKVRWSARAFFQVV